MKDYTGKRCWQAVGFNRVATGYILDSKLKDGWLTVQVKWDNGHDVTWEKVANLGICDENSEDKRIIYVDIDETICKTPDSRNYAESEPIRENIYKINKLYDMGNTIVYWTARGTGSGIDWRDVTENQFKSWGVKYHEIKFGKPIYDIFIDDKNINSETFFKSQV